LCPVRRYHPGVTADQQHDLVSNLRAGVPRLMALDSMGLTEDQLDAAMEQDADLRDQVAMAERITRARVMGQLYLDASRGDAAAAALWLRYANEEDAAREQRRRRRREHWHSGMAVQA
jgi:hypothetical protein